MKKKESGGREKIVEAATDLIRERGGAQRADDAGHSGARGRGRGPRELSFPDEGKLGGPLHAQGVGSVRENSRRDLRGSRKGAGRKAALARRGIHEVPGGSIRALPAPRCWAVSRPPPLPTTPRERWALSCPQCGRRAPAAPRKPKRKRSATCSPRRCRRLFTERRVRGVRGARRARRGKGRQLADVAVYVLFQKYL